jgi:hypothetical protein
LIFSVFRAENRCPIFFFEKRPTNALGIISVILLHNDYQHVLASQGGEYKNTNNTNIITMCQITPQFKNPTVFG